MGEEPADIQVASKVAEVEGIEQVLAVPEFYASAIRIATGVFGSTMLFARTRPAAVNSDEMVMLPSCVVHMSPAQAKSLFLLLRHQLRAHEQQWGAIPIPAELREKYGDLDG